MALKRISRPERTSRVALSLRESTVKDVDLYCTFYRELYGEEIDRNRLYEEIVRQFLERDVQYRAFKSRHKSEHSQTRQSPGQDPATPVAEFRGSSRRRSARPPLSPASRTDPTETAPAQPALAFEKGGGAGPLDGEDAIDS